MSYKEGCKTNGVIQTRVKLIRTVLSGTSQEDTATFYRCNKNTVGAIMRLYRALPEIEREQIKNGTSFTKDELNRLTGLACVSRKPYGHSRCLSGDEETAILSVHTEVSMGPRRMYTHLNRTGKGMNVYTLTRSRDATSAIPSVPRRSVQKTKNGARLMT